MLSLQILLVVLCLSAALDDKPEIFCVYDDNNCDNDTIPAFTDCKLISIRNISDSEAVHDIAVAKVNIYFCSNVLYLTDLIQFRKKKEVNIFGIYAMKSEICCNIEENSGLEFGEVEKITISDLTFNGCGALHNSTSLNTFNRNSTFLFQSCIYILKCVNVTISKVTVANVHGTGLAIFDTNGRVDIMHSVFVNNTVQEIHKHSQTALPGGGGLYIEFTYCSPGSFINKMCISRQLNTNGTYNIVNGTYNIVNGMYNIVSCTFENNYASSGEYINVIGAKDYEFQGLGRGGGMSIIFKGIAKNNTVKVTECNFVNNSAIWGGGLFSTFHDSPMNNSLLIERTNFTRNKAYEHGGGGSYIGYHLHQDSITINNTVNFTDCSFTYNNATYGGGVLMYSSQNNRMKPEDRENKMEFINCRWENNTALYGSALDISSHIWDRLNGILPTFSFIDCTFTNNYIWNQIEAYESYEKGKGSILSTRVKINLEGRMHFENNNGSAMYLTTTTVDVAADSKLTFIHNTGLTGGAIALLGNSDLHIRDNTMFTFINNTAVDRGGAIFRYSIDKHDYAYSRTCFIQYTGDKSTSERNITFLFDGNELIGSALESLTNGHSIFVTTLSPCYRGCLYKVDDYDDIFSKCIGNFTFKNEKKYHISTSAKKVKQVQNSSWPILIVPGKVIDLPIEETDDLSQKVTAVYRVSITNHNESIVRYGHSYEYISNNWLKLYGKASDCATITLETTTVSREIAYTFNVIISQCPPGYVEENSKCVCTADTNDKYYHSISKCNNNEFRAYLKQGFWIGYDESTEMNDGKVLLGEESNLLSGYCPRGFCFNNHSRDNNETQYLLPSDNSVKKLDELVCGPNRTGILCSRCSDNYSVYYHSNTYNCYLSERCEWGWLFYIISEILPVTALFLVIILFDINFTSGSVNGFIFFVQVIETILPTGNEFIRFPKTTFIFIRIYQFFFRMFNLFSLTEFPFCLWNGASTLNIITFQYLTMVYSLVLVVTTILAFKFCSFRRLFRCSIRRVCGRELNAKSTIIHGLSGFLVMCYSQCTKISLLLITPISLHTSGPIRNRTIVFYDGDLTFFHGKHLWYVFPALFFIFTIVLTPPILLVAYPLCYKVFACLGISESKFARCLCKCIPLEKLKPLFDSFQSCFKDEYRFFAGLYFFYRLTTLLTFAFTYSLTAFYVLVELQLIVILTLHSIVQPYKKRWHNSLDALILMNLAIINGMTLYNFHRTTEGFDYYRKYINIVSTIQTIHIYIPPAYMITYIAIMSYKKIRICSRRKNNAKSLVDEYDTPTRIAMIENRHLEDSEMQDYYQLKED